MCRWQSIDIADSTRCIRLEKFRVSFTRSVLRVKEKISSEEKREGYSVYIYFDMVLRNSVLQQQPGSFYDYLNDFASLRLFGGEPIGQEILSEYKIFYYFSFFVSFSARSKIILPTSY